MYTKLTGSLLQGGTWQHSWPIFHSPQLCCWWTWLFAARYPALSFLLEGGLDFPSTTACPFCCMLDFRTADFHSHFTFRRLVSSSFSMLAESSEESLFPELNQLNLFFDREPAGEFEFEARNIGASLSMEALETTCDDDKFAWSIAAAAVAIPAVAIPASVLTPQSPDCWPWELPGRSWPFMIPPGPDATSTSFNPQGKVFTSPLGLSSDWAHTVFRFDLLAGMAHATEAWCLRGASELTLAIVLEYVGGKSSSWDGLSPVEHFIHGLSLEEIFRPEPTPPMFATFVRACAMTELVRDLDPPMGPSPDPGLKFLDMTCSPQRLSIWDHLCCRSSNSLVTSASAALWSYKNALFHLIPFTPKSDQFQISPHTVWRTWLYSDLKSGHNPFTPKSDQFQISPAASPEILHHTVWRTWLFIAYSDERYYQFSPPDLYIFSVKG